MNGIIPIFFLTDNLRMSYQRKKDIQTVSCLAPSKNQVFINVNNIHLKMFASRFVVNGLETVEWQKNTYS